MKKIKLTIFIIFILSFLFFNPAYAQDSTVEAPFLPAIGDICKLSDASATPGQNAQSNWIAQCLSGLYRYAIVFGSTLAVLFFMIGGIMYLLAGGKSDYVSTGKSFITGSIFGIVLLLGSYLMLFLINPKLVEIPMLTFEAVEMEELDIIEQSELYTPSDWPVGTTVTKTPTINEITAKMFKQDSINGKSVNGWDVWQSLSETEKQQVIPYLKKQISACQSDQDLTTFSNSTFSQWNGKTINKQIISQFIQANQIAQSYGLLLKPGSVYRSTTEEGIPLWNTGIVGRYIQFRDKTVASVTESNWKNNQGKISIPTCSSPHNTGGAIDINLYDKNGKVLLSANSSGIINSSNYTTEFLNDPEKVLLEEIMHQAGFVRFCGEHWHFETKVTERYKRWDKTSRCWNYNETLDQPIPENIKNQVNIMTQELSGKNIFK